MSSREIHCFQCKDQLVLTENGRPFCRGCVYDFVKKDYARVEKYDWQNKSDHAVEFYDSLLENIRDHGKDGVIIDKDSLQFIVGIRDVLVTFRTVMKFMRGEDKYE